METSYYTIIQSFVDALVGYTTTRTIYKRLLCAWGHWCLSWKEVRQVIGWALFDTPQEVLMAATSRAPSKL
jgi:hypothetical protein